MGLQFNCTFSWLSFSVSLLVSELSGATPDTTDRILIKSCRYWMILPRVLSSNLHSVFVLFSNNSPPELLHSRHEESQIGDWFLYSLLGARLEPGYLELDHVKDQHILAHFNMIKAAVKPFRSSTFTQSLYWLTTAPVRSWSGWILIEFDSCDEYNRTLYGVHWSNPI